jgi:hypothetical protein
MLPTRYTPSTAVLLLINMGITIDDLGSRYEIEPLAASDS